MLLLPRPACHQGAACCMDPRYVMYSSSAFSKYFGLLIVSFGLILSCFIKKLIHKHNQLVHLLLAQADSVHYHVIHRCQKAASSLPTKYPISTPSLSTSLASLLTVVLMLLFSKISYFSKFLSLFSGSHRTRFTSSSPYEDSPES
jgi:hypothetical protein